MSIVTVTVTVLVLAGFNDNDAQSPICALAVGQAVLQPASGSRAGIGGDGGAPFFLLFLARGTRYRLSSKAGGLKIGWDV